MGSKTGIPEAVGAHVDGDGASAQLPSARSLRGMLRPMPTGTDDLLLESVLYRV